MLLRRSLPALFAVGALALTGCISVTMKNYATMPDQIVMLHYGPPVHFRDLEHGHHIPTWSKVSIKGAPTTPNPQVSRGRREADSEPKEGYIKRAKMLLYLLRSRHWRSLPSDQTS